MDPKEGTTDPSIEIDGREECKEGAKAEGKNMEDEAEDAMRDANGGSMRGGVKSCGCDC